MLQLFLKLENVQSGSFSIGTMEHANTELFNSCVECLPPSFKTTAHEWIPVLSNDSTILVGLCSTDRTKTIYLESTNCLDDKDDDYMDTILEIAKDWVRDGKDMMDGDKFVREMTDKHLQNLELLITGKKVDEGELKEVPTDGHVKPTAKT